MSGVRSPLERRPAPRINPLGVAQVINLTVNIGALRGAVHINLTPEQAGGSR